MKLALVLPAGTVIEAGTVAKVLLLANATTMPPVGAALAKVTVPLTEAPPVTLAAASVTEESVAVAAAGVTLSPAVLLTLL